MGPTAEQNGNTTAMNSKMATGITDAMASRKGEDGMHRITDLVEVSVLSMFFIQKLGKSYASQILEKMMEVKVEIEPHLLDQCIEALQARGFISYARGRVGEGGESVRMWKPKRVIWAAPPEVAQLIGADLLANLVATDEAQDLIDALNDAEATGDGEEKAKSRIQYAEYEQVRLFCITLDDWYGSQPASPLLDARVKDKKKAADLRFFRTEDGDLEISSDVVGGWLRTNMRQQDMSDAVAGYVACSPIRLSSKLLGLQAAFPVIDQRTRQGKGVTSYESLPPGTRFEMVFAVPTRGFCAIADFVAHVASIGVNPIRGLSPARGKKAGRFAVLRYENLGPVKTGSGTAALTTAMSLLPEGEQFDEARKFYAEQIERKEKDAKAKSDAKAEAKAAKKA